jgi:polysaccharide chain length determinant protein (PEP-CTERM system associated)
VSPAEIVHALGARRWVILIPFAIGLASTPLLARFAPERYRSETLILVVPQRVPDDYVKPTVTESVEERLPSITEQILSRSRLEMIIQEMDLYKAERAEQVMEDVVAAMRDDVDVGVSAKDGDSFRVSYVGENPEIARKVVERLASLYVEQNTTDRSTQAESTSQFIAAQLEDAKRRLIEQEKKLELYRKTHAGQLPTQLQANLQSIQNAAVQLQSLNDATNRAQERRLLIERQIADTEAVSLPSPRGTGGDAPAPASTADQLAVARARLAAALQRYTPEHHEVQTLERTVAELSARLADETPLGSSEAAAEAPMTPAEATQRKKILDLQAELAVVDHQLGSFKTEHDRLKTVIAQYQAKVDAAPTRESELVELTRDYSTLQAAYASLLMKREDSMIAANLERRKIGEQFRIIDPASRPEKPFNVVQRLMVLSSGAAAGLVVGLLLVLYRLVHDSSVKTEREVHELLKLPVLALIPIITSEREQRRIRRRRLAVDIAGSTMVLAALSIVVWRWPF